MFVSKEYKRDMDNTIKELWQRIHDLEDERDMFVQSVHSCIDTPEKQWRCNHKNFEVMWHTFAAAKPWSFSVVEYQTKQCKDCGLETKYETEEEAIADKQILLDRQIAELKEQKKNLK